MGLVVSGAIGFPRPDPGCGPGLRLIILNVPTP